MERVELGGWNGGRTIGLSVRQSVLRQRLVNLRITGFPAKNSAQVVPMMPAETVLSFYRALPVHS
jgi:hypothetical protein